MALEPKEYKGGKRVYSDTESLAMMGIQTLYEDVDISGGDYTVSLMEPGTKYGGSRVIMVTTPGTVNMDVVDRKGDTVNVSLYVFYQLPVINIVTVYQTGTDAEGIVLAN